MTARTPTDGQGAPARVGRLLESTGANPVQLSARMHARLARELIAACGGLDEAASACQLSRSRLSQCQTPPSDDPDAPPPAYLHAGAIAELEAYCGQPIYSRALVEARPAAAELKGVVEGVTDSTEDMAELQRLVRQLSAAGKPWSQRERLLVTAAAAKIRDRLAAVMAIVDQDLPS